MDVTLGNPTHQQMANRVAWNRQQMNPSVSRRIGPRVSDMKRQQSDTAKTMAARIGNRMRKRLQSKPTDTHLGNPNKEPTFNEGRKDGKPHERAFAVGTKMAEKEFADPSTAKKHKARRERLKKAGFRSVSAGMAARSKELRGEPSR